MICHRWSACNKATAFSHGLGLPRIWSGAATKQGVSKEVSALQGGPYIQTKQGASLPWISGSRAKLQSREWAQEIQLGRKTQLILTLVHTYWTDGPVYIFLVPLETDDRLARAWLFAGCPSQC